jgi:type IV secretory pathway TrbD component
VRSSHAPAPRRTASVRVAECPQCGAAVAAENRFCPECGRQLGEADTHVLPVPPEETGPVPVQRVRAEPRFYGVAPTTLVLVLAGAALTLAIVLFVLGRWPFALVLVGVSLLLLAVFVEIARRRPPGPVTRASAEALDHFRARANVAAGSLATRGRAMRQVVGLRRELRRMAAFRGQLLYELGDAVYRGDDEARETARGRIDELDQLAASTEARMQEVVATTERRIEERRLEVQPTEMVELPEQPSPAPGETTPPEPAVIPEPYPPPDEGTPPQPAIIPEPGPAVIPEPGPQPDTPEGRP